MGAPDRFDDLLSRLDQVGFDFDREFDKLALLRQKAFDALSDHDIRKRRLQIEIRLRQKYRKYRQNATYFAKGRFEKVDLSYLKSVIMDNDQLRTACHIHGIHIAQKGLSASDEDQDCAKNFEEEMQDIDGVICEPVDQQEPAQPTNGDMQAPTDQTLLYENKKPKKSIAFHSDVAFTLEPTVAASSQLPPASLPAKPKSPAVNLKRKLCPSADDSGNGKPKRRTNASHSGGQAASKDIKPPRISDDQQALPDYQPLTSSSIHYNPGHNGLPVTFNFPNGNDASLRNVHFPSAQIPLQTYSGMNLVPILVPADALAQVKPMGHPSSITQQMVEQSNIHGESTTAVEQTSRDSGKSSSNRHPETNKKSTKRSKAQALPHGTSIEKLLKPPVPKALKKMQKMARKYNL
ncbi:AaceriAGL163Wp [[Ashbya] aceris (nom. inval.)]|nr:AaceriAGL163Wp [[Ashbya] aceris (nom. inval.)]